MAAFSTYYWLTKPGIVWSNVLAAAAGFLMAAAGRPAGDALAATIVGTTLIVAAACVFNNVIDRGIDKKMARTRRRAMVAGEVSVSFALVYAMVMMLLGFSALVVWTNWLVVVIGAIGIVFYVVVYGIAKRQTVHGTLIGTISGSMPLLAGYVAVTERIDAGALLLIAIMTAWQMAHFYAIAIYRFDDYRAAGLPLLPIVRSVPRAQTEIVVYIWLFVGSLVALAAGGYVGALFLLVMLPVAVYWLWGAFVSRSDDRAWGRAMFGTSLWVLLLLCGMLAVGSVLP